jgi:uncharacterized protein Yka (UPF0111/DUF47 family)
MTAKVEIVKRLGEQAVLLPSLIAEALNANDRIKLRLTMLQAATAHASSVGSAAPSLQAERHAAGLSDPQFDRIITGARRLDGDRIAIPGVTLLLAGIPVDMATMLAPIEVVDPECSKSLQARFADLQKQIPSAPDGVIGYDEISRMTSARRGREDSLHLLVMDAHKALNRVAGETAVEVIDGAHVHHLEPEDRDRVAAFMRGLNRTAPLAFGHPGLATTAARGGARLTIQNDIGATDAHVLVIHVESNLVSVTYTDVHRVRAKFFSSLFETWNVEWSVLAEHEAGGLGKEDVFYLMTGRFAAETRRELDAFLTFLGSRIVFLIDWNKGRKALQTFVGKNTSIDLLTWAANNEVGHRAFLELGGADLVFDAIRHVAADRIPYGARLETVLGAEEIVDFLRQVLKEASRGLGAGRSARLIRDQIQADLAQRFETAENAVLKIIERHLGLSHTLASTIWTALAHPGSKGERQSMVRRAMRIEAKADRLTLAARSACAKLHDAKELRFVIDEVENAADAFDEGVFLISLLPEGEQARPLCEPLAELANLATHSTSEMVKAIAGTARLPEGKRVDAAFALQSIDAVTELERNADLAERSALAAFFTNDGSDAKTLMLGVEIARMIEHATDCLAHAAQALRDRVLEELSA